MHKLKNVVFSPTLGEAPQAEQLPRRKKEKSVFQNIREELFNDNTNILAYVLTAITIPLCIMTIPYQANPLSKTILKNFIAGIALYIVMTNFYYYNIGHLISLLFSLIFVAYLSFCDRYLPLVRNKNKVLITVLVLLEIEAIIFYPTAVIDDMVQFFVFWFSLGRHFNVSIGYAISYAFYYSLIMRGFIKQGYNELAFFLVIAKSCIDFVLRYAYFIIRSNFEGVTDFSVLDKNSEMIGPGSGYSEKTIYYFQIMWGFSLTLLIV